MCYAVSALPGKCKAQHNWAISLSHGFASESRYSPRVAVGSIICSQMAEQMKQKVYQYQAPAVFAIWRENVEGEAPKNIFAVGSKTLSAQVGIGTHQHLTFKGENQMVL